MIRKRIIKFYLYLILFFSASIISLNAQTLHHQMTSSQGNAFKLSNGYYVTQTIGQQSNVGNSVSENFRTIQGFQQSAWAQLISKNILPLDLSIITYPNPFVETINFKFSAPIEGELQILVFDTSGRLNVSRGIIAKNNLVSVNLYFLPSATYLVQIKNNQITYYTKIVKD